MHKLLLLLALMAMSPVVSASELTDAQQMFESGKYSQAMTRVDSYLKSKPKNAEARFLKGLILVEQGQSTAAIDVFTGLTKDYPELPEPYNNIAVIYAAEGDYDGARAALQAALKTHPSYATAYENLGDIYAKLASEAYQQALDLEKRDQGQGKLKVKLSLIDNLFMEERGAGQVVAVAQPVRQEPPPRPQAAAVERPKPVKMAVAKPPMPTPAVAKPQPVADQAGQIAKTIRFWASAWSSQDVDGYLSFYADSFRPATGSASKWRAQRHSRLTRPSYIRVELDDIRLITQDQKSARIELIQKYESNTYKDLSRKRFDMILVNGQWKIYREVSI